MKLNNDAKKFDPIDGTKSPRFTQPATFGRLSYRKKLNLVDSVFAGVPFDDGTSFRSGTRMGPAAVREASRAIRPYNPVLKISPFSRLNTIDYGDINIVPGYIEDTFENIQEEVKLLVSHRITPFFCGGDHSITLPILRQISKKYGKVNLFHFDSHFDFWDKYWGKKFTHGTWLKRAFEENLVKKVVQVGIHGGLYSENDAEFAIKNNIDVHMIEEIHGKGIDNAMSSILRRRILKEPTYITVDIDVVDPAYAAGTGTPEIGGLSSWELITAIRKFAGFNLVGFDVVEVNPLYDGPGQITSLLAANIFFEAMSVRALNVQ